MTFKRVPTLQFSPAVRPANRPAMARALRGHVGQRVPLRLRIVAGLFWVLLAGCAVMPFAAIAWAWWRAGR